MALRYVDLTHELSSESVFWPTGDTIKLTTVADGVTEQGYYYASNNFSGNEHGGTHLDAPVHFAAGKWTTDQIPLDRLIGSTIVVNVSTASAANADHQVTVADFTGWEATHGAIEPDTIVLIRTDFAKRWPNARSYLGTEGKGADALAKLHFPGLHPDAARWLVEKRVKAVGLDWRTSTTGSQHCSNRTASCTSATSRRSRTWRRSTRCRRVGPRCMRCR